MHKGNEICVSAISLQWQLEGKFRARHSKVLEAGEIMQVSDRVLLGGNRTVKIQELL